MPIVVTPTYNPVDFDSVGTPVAFEKLAVSGLVAGSNTVPHGLPRTPRKVILVPGAAGLWGETSAADATNIFITVGTGGALAGTVYVEY